VRELRRDLCLVMGVLFLFLLTGRLVGGGPQTSAPADALAAPVSVEPMSESDLAVARRQVEALLAAYLGGAEEDAPGRVQPFLSPDAQLRYPFVGQFFLVPRLRVLRPVGYRLPETRSEEDAVRVVADLDYVDPRGQTSTLRWGLRLVRNGTDWSVQSIQLWSSS
jgi:hypothetical protein